MTDPDFDDLNPPLAPVEGDTFFGCLTWVLIAFAAFGLWTWLT